MSACCLHYNVEMNQFPQVMLPTMGMTPQFAPGTVMPGAGMMLPPPPIGLPIGMSPGNTGYTIQS